MQQQRSEFGAAVGAALRAELGSTYRAIKTVSRWTGASERTVKHWFAGHHAPSGDHFVALARHSDQVLTEFLVAANRDSVLVGLELAALRLRLIELADLIGREVR